jgi:hypothetical protein
MPGSSQFKTGAVPDGKPPAAASGIFAGRCEATQAVWLLSAREEISR